MIRHLAELSALLLCFAVGVGLLAAFGIGLLLIWGKRLAEDLTLGDEYRRVESAALATGSVSAVGGRTGGALSESAWLESAGARIITQPRPYNWATREPMVWQEAK